MFENKKTLAYYDMCEKRIVVQNKLNLLQKIIFCKTHEHLQFTNVCNEYKLEIIYKRFFGKAAPTMTGGRD